ncbi:hypothetical protein THAOC_15431, partial [Thalassiosira oceanica]
PVFPREQPRRNGNFVELMHRPMGPGTGEGDGFRPKGHRGARTAPGVGRESDGLEFEIARSSTGDDAASAARIGCFSTSAATTGGRRDPRALPMYHWGTTITSDRPQRLPGACRRPQSFIFDLRRPSAGLLPRRYRRNPSPSSRGGRPDSLDSGGSGHGLRIFQAALHRGEKDRESRLAHQADTHHEVDSRQESR